MALVNARRRLLFIVPALTPGIFSLAVGETKTTLGAEIPLYAPDFKEDRKA